MSKKYDFAGHVTRNDILCSDGVVIKRDAFKGDDKKKVPLVWNHNHNEPSNVLGHVILHNQEDGVYGYGYFNDSAEAQDAKLRVQHGDIVAMSIAANRIKKSGRDVVHGKIYEVSLVLAGANPGAYIDTVISHSDSDEGETAIIYTDEIIHSSSYPNEEEVPGNEDTNVEVETVNKEVVEEQEVQHADEAKTDELISQIQEALTDEEFKKIYDFTRKLAGPDVKDENLMDALSEEDIQKVSDFIINLLDDGEESKEETKDMKQNIFAGNVEPDDVLTHAEMTEIIKDGKRYGSLKESVLEHTDGQGIMHAQNADGTTQSYGIANIDYLFPDARLLNNKPDFIQREMDWVTKVMNGTHHTPFSRIKTVHADITADEARAKGYIKGKEKVNEVFTLLKRATTPTTIYKKQKLDRDDIVDITDFDVVAWVKAEMRMMLNEEIARAILFGDGRLSSSQDKINEGNVRPIATDNALYSVPVAVSVAHGADDDAKAKAFIKAVIKSRKEYKGSGNPTLYTTEDVLTNCLLLEDVNGRVIYDTEEKLRTALRVKEIVTVEPMEGAKDSSGTALNLMGIVVNLADYSVGADKGGAVNLFDDFDIDYNQEKYLIETRISGALTKPHSALVLTLDEAAE